MTKETVTINGVTVKVVADPDDMNCRLCAFNRKCPKEVEELLAGTIDCVIGHHYYEKVVEGDTV